jgi:DNA-binding beta-propeller fold protein YncE
MLGLASRPGKARSGVLLAATTLAVLLAFAVPAQAAHYVYVADADGDGPSVVSQFNVGAGGLLAALSPPTVAAGSGPDGVAVSPDGRSVYVTNVLDNTVSQYDVGANGTLSPKSPATIGGNEGPLGLAVSPNGKQLYVADGATDRVQPNITFYDVASNGTLALRGYAKSLGQDPQSLALSPDGKSLYLAQCCVDHGVAQFDVTSNGGLAPKTPAWVHIGDDGAGVAVSPNGKSVYVTEYVGSTIYQFNVGAGGKLSPKNPASVPAPQCCTYGVVVSPDGKSLYVANTGGSVSQFNVGTGGKLSAKNPAKVTTGGQFAQGIAVTPDGKSVYVTNTESDSIAQFDVGVGGKLSPKSPAAVAGGSGPIGVAVNPLGGPASVSVFDDTLVVNAAPGHKDNLAITRPQPGTLRVTDFAGGAYTGSTVFAGAGCTLSGTHTANCNAAGVTLIRASSADLADKVANSTGIKGSLFGGKGPDTLLGSSGADVLTGGPDPDVMKGMNGSDQLLARDGTSDTTINCDGGNAPGAADRAFLDPLPDDPSSVVTGCETKDRP